MTARRILNKRPLASCSRTQETRLPAPRSRLVYLLTVEDRPEEARAVLWELHRLTGDPRHLAALAGLASVDAASDAKGLEPELLRLLEGSPDDPLLRRARGLMLLRQGHPAEALPFLEPSATAEDDLVGRLALVECRLALGRAEGSEAALGPEPSRPKDRGQWWEVSDHTDGRPRSVAPSEMLVEISEASRDSRPVPHLAGVLPSTTRLGSDPEP